MRSRFFYLGSVTTLIGMLVTPVFGNSQTLTTSEVRTLKNAVAVLKYLPDLATISATCEAEVLQYLPITISDDNPMESITVLFQEKLHLSPQQLDQLLQQNPKFKAITALEPQPVPSCEAREALIDFAEQYSNNLTALELSSPLAPWLHYFEAPVKAAAMDPVKLKSLIGASHSLVVVEVKPKQLLNAMQQANFLHIDDKNSYIFEVQQGWKAISPRYLGLHIFMDAQNYPQQPKRWLLMLDVNFHPKTVLHGAQMQQALALLGSADWSFDRQGDLLRATNGSSQH